MSLIPTATKVTKVVSGDTRLLTFNITCQGCEDHIPLDNMQVEAVIDNQRVAILLNHSFSYLTNSSAQIGILVRGIFLGKTFLNFKVSSLSNSSEVYTSISYPIDTLRRKTILDQIFVIIVSILVGFNTIAYACMLDLGVVKTYLKKPVGIIIGFVCQYAVMPLVSMHLQ